MHLHFKSEEEVAIWLLNPRVLIQTRPQFLRQCGLPDNLHSLHGTIVLVSQVRFSNHITIRKIIIIIIFCISMKVHLEKWFEGGHSQPAWYSQVGLRLQNSISFVFMKFTWRKKRKKKKERRMTPFKVTIEQRHLRNLISLAELEVVFLPLSPWIYAW